MEELGFSSEDLSEAEVLNKVSERLSISAIIKGVVNKYEIKKKKDYWTVILDEGASTVATNIYICDISLIIEMIEAKEGNKLWSCSISVSQKKGKPEKLIRNRIRSSLNTIHQE